MKKQKEERFEKIVEKEAYDWQRGYFDLSHLFCLLVGMCLMAAFLLTIRSSPNTWIPLFLAVFIVVIFALPSKVKVYYRRMR